MLFGAGNDVLTRSIYSRRLYAFRKVFNKWHDVVLKSKKDLQEYHDGMQWPPPPPHVPTPPLPPPPPHVPARQNRLLSVTFFRQTGATSERWSDI